MKLIEESAMLYPEHDQVCTCNVPINSIIHCRRHLSKNQGCIWCAETDCGKNSC